MESDLGEKGLTFTMENKKLQNLTETENLAENVVGAAAEQKLENSQDPDAQTRKEAAELVNNAAVDLAAAAGNIDLSAVENAGVNGVTLVKLEQSGSDKFEEPVVQEPDTNGDKVQGSGDAFGYSDGFTLPVDIKVEAANELQEKIGWVGEMQNSTYVSDDAAEQMSNGEDHMVGVKFQESGNGIGDSDGLALTVRIKVEAANELQEKIVGVGEMQNSSYVSDGAVEQMSNGEDHMDGVQFQESGNGFGDSDGFTIPVDVKVEAANALKEKISGVGEMQNSTYVSDDALEQTSNGEDHMDGVQFQESGNGFGDSDGFTLPVDVKVEAVNALKEKTSGVGEMQNSTYVSDDAAEQTSNGEDHMDGVKFQESSNGLGGRDGFTLPVDTQSETVAARKEKISWFDEMQNSVPAGDNGGKLMNEEMQNGDPASEYGGKLVIDNEVIGNCMTASKEISFHVGDFVWGKIKPSDPWWPGQIYDPSDASECALKMKQKNRVLIAYFGFGTFSWCTASQLKPFEEQFEEMTKQTNSPSFVNALSMALVEYKRTVEKKLQWPFMPEEILCELEPQLAKNIGIKDGVLVPEARMGSHLSALMWPATSIALMKKIAVDVSAVNSLDLTVLKGRLSAFYRWKGIERLNICPDPLTIPGLEDKTVLKPKRGPSDDEDYYPQGGQLHPIRKRGLNELLNADSQNSKSDGDGVNLKFQKRMRIKVTNPISGAPRMRPREFIYVEKGKTETDEETPNKETEKPYLLSRERKRSKYLSPPYMDISDGLSYHRRKSLPESVMKADEAEVAEKERSESTKPGNKAALSMIRAAAVNPTEKNWPLDKVSGFASAFRSSVCIYESDKESYNKDRQASAADFNFIKEKLEKMSKMLEESETPNPSLLAEMKDLLGKVSGMAAKVE